MRGAQVTEVDRPPLIAQLTSLRFFAAMGVVVFHAGSSFAQTLPQVPTFIKTLIGNGYLGVPFFFVLSGFILQHVYGGRLGADRAIGRYLLARAARIYPVYLLGTLAMVPLVAPAGWADVPQFLLLQHWLPQTIYQASEWNLPGWTLSVELFFYLLFPLLMPAFLRLSPRGLWVVMAALIVIVMLTESAAIVDTRRESVWLQFVPPPLIRLPEFLIGLATGELHRRGGALPVALPGWLLVGSFLVVMGLSPSRAMAGVVVLFSMAMILTFAQGPKDPVARALGWAPLVLLGGASYALYILHIPLNAALGLVADGSRLVMLAQYPLAIIVSVAVFIWYEEPLREWIRRRARMAPSAYREIAEV